MTLKNVQLFLAQSIEDSCKTLYKKEVMLWMPLWDLKGT